MAGRPIDTQLRAQRLAEIDTAILSLQNRRLPITRKTIAGEMGLTVQALYGSGYLSKRIEELEDKGVISSVKAAPSKVTEAEWKALLKANKKLETEKARLTKKNTELTTALDKKEQEIADLNEEIKRIKGELFRTQQFEFTQNRI